MTTRTCNFCEKQFEAAKYVMKNDVQVKREELGASIEMWMKAARTKMAAQAAEEAARVRVEEARQAWALALLSNKEVK